MMQICLKPAGTMLAAVSLAVALAACDAATAQDLRQSAEVDAAAILKSFVVPPGGRPLAKPPSLIGGPHQTPRLADGQIFSVDEVSFWEAPGDPQAVLAWERAHLPSRFTERGSSGIPPVFVEFRASPKRRADWQEPDGRGDERWRRADCHPGGCVGDLAAAPAGQ